MGLNGPTCVAASTLIVTTCCAGCANRKKAAENRMSKQRRQRLSGDMLDINCTAASTRVTRALREVCEMFQLAGAIANRFGLYPHSIEQREVEIGHRRFGLVDDVAARF